MDVVNEDTLPDDAWKDSFDKLLEQRPILRELNVIKRDVRASFNMNSSYENSSYDDTASARQNYQKTRIASSPSPPDIHYLAVPKCEKSTKVKKRFKESDVISTPIKSHLINPFKCTLSPIGPWDLRHFKANNRTNGGNNVAFNATPIIDNDINAEYVDEIVPEVGVNETLPKYLSDVSPLALVRNKWKSKYQQKQFCFPSGTANDNDEKNGKILTKKNNTVLPSLLAHELNLQPGKWRKSLNYLRRSLYVQLDSEANRKYLKQYHKERCTDGVLNLHKLSIATTNVAGHRKSVLIRPNSTQTCADPRSKYSLGCNDFRRQVLQCCGQRRILTFEGTYSKDYLQNCRKIGEGAFGEVFLYTNPQMKNSVSENREKTVLKIIPIEGKELVNGEVQKTFEQILPEVIISLELCSLSNVSREANVTSGYVHLKKVRCVKGQYPVHLQKLWEEYDVEKESENDHPKCFSSRQLYIILELAFCGQDLERFIFKNAEQSFYALQQIILTLAIGENEYQFEHRDLHWGNVLVLNTNQPFISYKLGGNTLTVPTKGVKVTIIDYTLSRMTLNDYCFYNDLSNDDELFIAKGDYQFDIYRMMRDVLNNKWETFEPKTNIFWISYVISKLLQGVSYKNHRSKIHLQYKEKLKQLQKSILTYESCEHLAKHVFSLKK